MAEDIGWYLGVVNTPLHPQNIVSSNKIFCMPYAMVAKNKLLNVIRAKGPSQHFKRSLIKMKSCISAYCEVI